MLLSFFSRRLHLPLFLLLSCIPFACTAQEQGNFSDNSFSDQELGQLVMIGFRGTSLDTSDVIAKQVIQYNPAGFVLFDYDVQEARFGRNITSDDQLRGLTNTLRSLTSTPPFIAVDQEGGKVNRLKSRYGFPASRSAQYLGSLDSEDSTRFYASLTASLLSQVGINVNFAPVTDLNINPDNPVIGGYERSFSAEASTVTRHARFVIEEQASKGVLSVLKHFPGHGSSDSDSHIGFTDVSMSWKPTELTPYSELLGENEKIAVMTAHIFNTNLDDQWPATLSSTIIGSILRDSLGYNGVIFSDDMQMGAITENYGLETAIRQALLAGVDILIFGNNLIYEEDILARSVAVIRTLVETGTIPPHRIRESLDRITRLKQELQLTR